MTSYINATAAIHYYMLAALSGEREVGGFFEFYVDEKGRDVVTELHPVEQESTSCYFEISEVAKALFLEDLVAKGKDPANIGLFHTHPSGMGASMSSTDVKQLKEMATDLPGVVVRSMILSQGRLNPTMHEAVCVDGKVFITDDQSMSILDNTGAMDALKQIKFFDKPKPVEVKNKTGYTKDYDNGFGTARRELAPVRKFDYNDGWYDEAPEVSESDAWGNDPSFSAEYNAWLDSQKKAEGEAEEWIGEQVIYHGKPVTVVDAYAWDGDIVLVLPDNTEMRLEDATMAVPDQQAQ